MIGIHSPEFDREKLRSTVEESAARHKRHNPIMMDNDFAYWKALGNHYWPAFYVVDKQGVIAAQVIGEVHAGDSDATLVDDLIAELLERG